jgi:hypothetical protein
MNTLFIHATHAKTELVFLYDGCKDVRVLRLGALGTGILSAFCVFFVCRFHQKFVDALDLQMD